MNAPLFTFPQKVLAVIAVALGLAAIVPTQGATDGLSTEGGTGGLSTRVSPALADKQPVPPVEEGKPKPGDPAWHSALAEEGPKPKPVDPVPPEEIEASIRRGVAFLLEKQNKDGSWSSARNTKELNIYAPVPGSHLGFRAAVTAMCVTALTETRYDTPEVAAAIQRGEEWLFANLAKVRRADGTALYNNWAHAYSIAALACMRNQKPDDAARREKIDQCIAQQIDMLGRYECVDGGWCYYDFVAHTEKPSGSTISFVTATVLVALHDAQQVGAKIPEKLIQRAVESIRRQRKPDFSYIYGEYLKMRPMHPVNRPGGSLGRSQACSLAMRLWGDKSVTDEVLITWLDRLFARNLWLDIGRKRPIPHESYFSVAGYFFYYGHYYAARCIQELEPAKRPEYQAHLAHVLIPLQEKDGSWWDYPFYDYHQQYGTAFGIMTLVRCRPEAAGKAP
jgi:hypothetical protein